MMDNGLLNESDKITKDNIARVLWNMEFDPDKIPKNVLECLSSDKNSPKMFAERMKYRRHREIYS